MVEKYSDEAHRLMKIYGNDGKEAYQKELNKLPKDSAVRDELLVFFLEKEFEKVKKY